jgi:hypothetical protein
MTFATRLILDEDVVLKALKMGTLSRLCGLDGRPCNITCLITLTTFTLLDHNVILEIAMVGALLCLCDGLVSLQGTSSSRGAG